MTADFAGLDGRLGRLKTCLAALDSLLIAYSGGVDSSCLLAVASEVLGDRALGVIADSPSLPRASLQAAIDQARAMNATVEVIATTEFSDPDYSANPPNRCYFCKAELFQSMEKLARSRGFAALAYGENADDPPTARPGSLAAREFAVLAPLREAGLGKADVREIARRLGLESHDAPSQPCLSSRIPHGIPVTPESVALIERGEEAVRALGFRILRVRLAEVDPPAALVQVAPSELPALHACADRVRSALLGTGFAKVEIDPAGYRGAGIA